MSLVGRMCVTPPGHFLCLLGPGKASDDGCSVSLSESRGNSSCQPQIDVLFECFLPQLNLAPDGCVEYFQRYISEQVVT